MPAKRTSTLATLGLVALTLVGTATSALADRNQYTRGHMMYHHRGHWHHGYHRYHMFHHHRMFHRHYR